MELKDYQHTVLNDLNGYLEALLDDGGLMPKAFEDFWRERGVRDQHYKNNVEGVPHVCIKVPTAGGKTFIAVNALDNIFRAFEQYNPARARFVVWLVPSTTILEQTVKALSDVDHPYRQQLNALFSGRVQVYEKADVLQGAGFNADSVREQLSIVVMTFDSLKGKSKDVLKAYQDNGYLASFLNNTDNDDVLLPEYDKTALINVIRTLKPVLVVDESHNAETALSVDMLKTLNPSFILDLTATPRNNSNIISYVDAMQLKKQHMVKLPVIVANQQTQEDVIHAALKMRFKLEEFAKQCQKNGAPYIRPIVLFQAEPKSRDDATTFEKIKRHLMDDLNILEKEIKIKTATINELKGVDLMSPDCVVRYIITINALKEGWDCPFAYVLATLANKSSVVDVTQILGRVLRNPHVRRHEVDYLNCSFVFTASSKFNDTLTQVIVGLNNAGFSERDYREVDATVLEAVEAVVPVSPEQEDWVNPPEIVEDNEATIELDVKRLNSNWQEEAANELAQETQGGVANHTGAVDAVMQRALEAAQEYELQAALANENECPIELEGKMNIQKMMPMYADFAQTIALPQFFQKVETGGFFDEGDDWQQLSRNDLLSGFELANLDATVSFDDVRVDMRRVDLKETEKGMYSLEHSELSKLEKQKLNAIIRNQSNEGQVKSVVARLFGLIGKNVFYPIEDFDVKKYLKRIVEAMSPEQRGDCLDHDYLYIKTIKQKIYDLASEHAAREFDNWLRVGKIRLQPEFKFSSTIAPSEIASPIEKSLYIKEGKINGLEQDVIQKVAALDNVLWWHRNLERGKGFVINGFVNHYPDFVVLTSKQNLILIETKGGDRDNSDSKTKLKLGKAWENKANMLSNETGLGYHYMMVFDSNPLGEAYDINAAMDLIKQL